MDVINKPKKKIVWLCSFTNAELQRNLNYEYYQQVAPWITDLIQLFKNNNDIDLTIISPNYYNNRDGRTRIGSIEIILFKYRLDWMPHRGYNLNYNFARNRKKINTLITQLQPDLIQLHGSENPFYSSAVLDISIKIPVLVTIQGFISSSPIPNNPISKYIRWNRIRIERLINERLQYFTSVGEDMDNLIYSFNKDARIYRAHYPTKKPDMTQTTTTNIDYDIVYYARITFSKGIEDLIKVLSNFKRNGTTLKALIMGGGAVGYVHKIKSMIRNLDLEDVVTFAGYQESQEDVFRMAIRAKIYVLPTHFDGLPGSLREAMFLRIPVIANAVGGIPELNSSNECITLTEKGNLEDLETKIKLVLEDTSRTLKLVNNAYRLISSKYDNSKIYSNYLDIYTHILEAK